MKPNLHSVEGGVGKHLQFTALFPELVKKYNQKLVINSAYPELFTYSPEVAVSKILPCHADLLYDTYNAYFNNYDQLFLSDPYMGNFLKGKTHVVEEWATQYEIEVKDIRPSFTVNPIREKILLSSIKKLNQFILLQFTGGQGVIDLNYLPYNTDNKGRNYKYGQELINLLREAFPTHLLIVFSHNNERQEFIGETKINDEGGNPLFMTREDFMILSRHCSFFISIDSALYHMCSHQSFNKKGIGLWGTTVPERFGYKENINLQSEYPYCVEIKPQVIVDEALGFNTETPQGYGDVGWVSEPLTPEWIVGKKEI